MSFQPTLGVFETARNVKNFCKENKAHFRKLLIPLLPFLFATGLVQFVPHDTTEMKVLYGLMILLQIYLYTMLAVTWHRFTILGPDSDQEINVFEKKEGVWPYLGFSVVMGLISFAIMLPGILVTALLGQVLGPLIILLVLVIMIAALYVTVRLAIILPSIAIGHRLTIKQAFPASKGLVLKLIFTPMVAAVKPILLMIAYMIVIGIIVVIVAAVNPDLVKTADVSLGFSIFLYILFLPIVLYLQPWMTILGVTSLSNYYLWAAQNVAKQPPAQTDTLPPV